jgi:hypothetical protein
MESPMKHYRTTADLPLPHCKSNHAAINYPNYYRVNSETLLSVPKSVNIDGVIAYGGSTSAGPKITHKAYGEFFERNHFFNNVPVDIKMKLSDIHPIAHRDKLLSLCDTNKLTVNDCLEHEFSFTTIKNIFNEQAVLYFSYAISLSGHRDDMKYLGFNDSCGCASHPIKEKALLNSMMEFLERQAMVGSWLSKTYQYTINPTVLREITPYQELVDLLLENGELIILQNGCQLPAYSIIMFYFSHSKDDLVQYSTGASGGLSLESALNSAFEELFQCYSFLYNTDNTRDLKDKAGVGYALDFQASNKPEVRDAIPFMQDIRPFQINTMADVVQLQKYSFDQILDALSVISQDIYYYHHYDKTLGLHFTKVLCPDFFSHMSLSHHLNIDNLYAQSLKITKENAFMEKIPFP